MNSERMSFDEACRELGVTEAELESLVAAGEIASLKEGDTLYFKKEVVRKFKKSRDSEPTILLADEELSLLDSGEEIDLLAMEDEATTPTKAAPTEKVGSKKEAGARIELSLDEDVEIETRKEGGKTEVVSARKSEEVKMQKKKAEPEESGDETLLSLDGLLEDDSEGTTPIPAAAVDDSTLLDTDLLDLGGEGEADPFSSDTVEETAVDLTEQGTLLRGGGARVMQMKRKESHAAWTVVLALAAVILILPLGVLTGLIFAQSPQSVTKAAEAKQKQSVWIEEYNFLQGPVEMLADFFRGK
jgi:hypothetical protein